MAGWLPSRASGSPWEPRHPSPGYSVPLGVGRAEVGEVGEQVGVGFEALGGDFPVAQPGEAVAVDVLDGPAAVGVEGGLGAVEAQDVGQYLQGGRLGLFGRVAGAL